MRPLRSILAIFLLIPTLAVAQSLDITDEPSLPLSETDNSASAAPPNAEDLEGQVNSTGPVIIEPKFDLTAEPADDLDNASSLNQAEPEPAPGLVIKIPTNP